MYERPDVPKGGKHANLIAVIALVVIAIAAYFLVTNLWRLANEHSKLGDSKLSDAVAAATVEPPAAEGHVPTGADITNVLFVLVGDGDDAPLAGLKLASLNKTQGSAKLLDIPIDVVLDQEDGTTAALAYDGTSGKAANVAALVSGVATTGGASVSHVVVMRSDGWEELMATAQSGASALASKAQDLMGAIVRSDMAAEDLLALAQDASGAGLGSAEVATVPLTDAHGIDSLALALQVGAIAQG